MMITLTLSFDTLAEVQHTLSQIGSGIAYLDRPDVGVELSPTLPAAVPVKVDGGHNPFAVSTTLDPGVAPAAPAVLGVAVAPAAPTAPAAPAAAPIPPSADTAPIGAPGVELDSAGLPWDGRIHGSTKTKNADGSWRQKRGLNDPALKLRVETELRAGQAARAPVAPAGLVAAVAAPPAPAAPPAETFGTLMARLAPLVMTDAAAAVKINTVLAQYGLQSLAQLGARPDLVGNFAAHADAALAAA